MPVETYSLMYFTHYAEAGRMNTRYFNSETNGKFTWIYLELFLKGDGQADYNNSYYMSVVSDVSPKLMLGNAKPLFDFIFIADPTAVEQTTT